MDRDILDYSWLVLPSEIMCPTSYEGCGPKKNYGQIGGTTMANFRYRNFCWCFALITWSYGIHNRGIPKNGWFIVENHIKMDDLGGTSISGNLHISPVQQLI